MFKFCIEVANKEQVNSQVVKEVFGKLLHEVHINMDEHMSIAGGCLALLCTQQLASEVCVCRSPLKFPFSVFMQGI